MAAYVSVPRDLTRVKSKILFNLTKRQLICFGTAALIGVPSFFLLKKLERVPVIATVYTLLVAVCGWVLFDLPSIGAAAAYYSSMFGLIGKGLYSAADLF